MQLIDIGANLTHESFATDLEQVLQRAQDSQIAQIIVTGANAQGNQQAVKLAESFTHLYATCGVHPHEAKQWNNELANSHKILSQHKQVVAIGECGLDYYRDFSPRAQQQLAFEAQLDIACTNNKPVFLHQRDAHDDFITILDKYRHDLSRIVVHCFTGTEHELQDYLARDCYIGITGWICDERRGHHLRDFIQQIPADRLMIETDAPYLLPRDIRPKPKSRRNEPMWLKHIAKVIADCVGKPVEQLAAETTATAKTFFELPEY